MSTNYPPPRTPLPPHKLAKIANAFGVSSPLPHLSSFHRSETLSPSSASTVSFSTRHSGASKYLLHVIPPAHLPCNRDEDDDLTSNYSDEDDNESIMTAQQQFRRGVLVPLQPTLKAQLGAIAREYSLPSTGGMMLYLASSPTSPAVSESGSPSTATQGLGPRITDHVWSLLWHRVLRSEREDSARSLLGAGSVLGSLPAFSRSPTIDGSHGIQTPSSTRSRSPAPSPLSTTPSSPPYQVASGLPSRLQFSTANQSTPYLPSTSQAPSPEPDYDPLTDFNLNFGQNPESLLPILAKVEFDIDRRTKAGAWYEPLREQRAAKYRQRQAEREARQPPKRKKFILPTKRDTLSERERTMAEEIERLRTLVANSKSPMSTRNVSRSGYAVLDDMTGNGSDSDSGSDIDETEIFSTRIEVSSVEQVFSDEAALRDIRRSKRLSKQFGVNRDNSAVEMPKLKLDGATLTEEDEDEDGAGSRESQFEEDEKEILAMWEAKNRPTLGRPIQPPPPPPDSKPSPPKRLAQRPPPLDLSNSASRGGQLQTPTPISHASETTNGSARLAYLSSPAGSEGPLASSRFSPTRQTSDDSAAANEVGSRLSAMDDEEDGDETWGNRASQEPSGEPSPLGEEEVQELQRKVKLDELEQRITQFSPRSSGFYEGETSIHTVLPSDLSRSTGILNNGNNNSADSSMSEELVLGPPRSSSMQREAERKAREAKELPPPPPAKTTTGLKSALKPSRPPPPPPIPAKELPIPSHQPSTSVSSASLLDVSPAPRLKDELDWPPAPSPDRRSGVETGSPPASPSYPLSPDPFRRPDWSESPPIPPTPEGQAKLPSRFSADSEYEASYSRASTGSRQRSNSIVSVKNIRNLWRKSGSGQPDNGGGLIPAGSGSGAGAGGETEPVPPLPAHFSMNAKHMKRPSIKSTLRPDSDADPFHFDQVKGYAAAAANEPTSATTPTSSNSSLVNTNASNTGSVRKSILKSWKGAPASTPTPSPLPEIIDPQGSLSDKEKRKRRPSVLDLASTSARNMLKRNSRSSRSSVASASTVSGGIAIVPASRSTTPDPGMLYEGYAVDSGNLLSAAPRTPLSGIEPLAIKTPQRTTFDIPPPTRLPPAPQGSWI